MQSDHPMKQNGEAKTAIQILNVNHWTQKLIGLYSDLALIEGSYPCQSSLTPRITSVQKL